MNQAKKEKDNVTLIELKKLGETERDPEVRFDEHVHQYHSEWMKRNGWRPRRPIYFEAMPDCYSKDIALLREQQLKHDRCLKKEMQGAM